MRHNPRAHLQPRMVASNARINHDPNSSSEDESGDSSSAEDGEGDSSSAEYGEGDSENESESGIASGA